MAKVARIDGQALFGDEQWAHLSQRSDALGLWMVVHAWLIIALAAGVAIYSRHPVVVLIAALIIGSRQLGVSILMHDAAHGLLLNNKRWNDRVGQWLCAMPIGIDMFAYRAYHMNHHRFAQQDEDPDLPLSAPFPITRWSFVRKALRDLSGLTFLKLRVLPWFLALLGRYRLTRSDVSLLVSNLIVCGLCYGFGIGWAFWLLWLLPLATWQMFVTRIRNIAEHACLTRENDPWRVARTTVAGPLSRAFLAPYFVNFHAEHHLFMWTPCYRLPGIHEAMKASGQLDIHKVPFAPNYASVLHEVSS